jgi:hypothetical protein
MQINLVQRGIVIPKSPQNYLQSESETGTRFFLVIAGHSRPKDGVASARLCPAIHLLLKNLVAKIDGCPDPGYANRLRPKADFGGQEASPGQSSVGPPKL